MQNEDYIYNGERVVRVNKKVARKMYNDGKQIWLIPDMMRLDNAWQSPCPISKEDNGGDREFDARVNEFVYYNCDSRRGKGVKYFVKESLLQRDSIKDGVIDIIYGGWSKDYGIPIQTVKRSAVLILSEEQTVNDACRESGITPEELQSYINGLKNPTDKDLQVGTILLDII